MAQYKYKHRAGTLAQWANPVDGPPLRAEIVVLLDGSGAPLLAKIGDGSTAFADLPALGGGGSGGAGGVVSAAGSPNLILAMWSGTEAEYAALPTKDPGVLYFTE